MSGDQIETMAIGDVARRLGVSYRGVYELIDQGRLPAVRKDGRIVIEATAVTAYLGREDS